MAGDEMSDSKPNPLEDLKVGDRVIVDSRDWYGRGRVAIVDKVTPKQVVVGQSRFWKDGGRELTSGYRAERIRPATDEAVAEIELKDKRDDLIRVARDWFTCYQRPDLMTTAELEAVGSAIASAKARNVKPEGK